MKYEKFEEWMLGKKVTHVCVRSSGVIVERPDEDDPDICVRVKYDEGCLAGDTVGAWLRNLEFLEEKPSEEVGAQENSQINWEGSQIDWQVGQVVWDTVHGKGEVTRVDESFYYPVGVEFDNGDTEDYTLCGEIHEQVKRSLFFSEPVITAELFPPKKPFVPTLKKGDTVVVKWVDTTQVLIVREETERQVKGSCGEVWDKDPDVHFYKIGEEIKFQ